MHHNQPEQNTAIAQLKGVGDGLRVTVDPSQPFDVLERELVKIFTPLNHLSINARVVIDTGEDEGHERLIERLGVILKEKYNVGSVSGKPQKPSARMTRIRQRELENNWQNNRSDVLMMTGRVRAGQKITAKKHLVLMGDVNPGGEIIAGGDVIVLGSLRGTAIAGQPENDNSFIFALDFRPTQVQIGGLVAAGLPSSSNRNAEYAHVERSAIVVENYLEANPFSKMPWPEKR